MKRLLFLFVAMVMLAGCAA
ncbi:MAG: lipoprotein, partial [Oscillospiraceae bacterium]|nr:lipoprotein [Oscillospiraceae bacterium]